VEATTLAPRRTRTAQESHGLPSELEALAREDPLALDLSVSPSFPLRYWDDLFATVQRINASRPWERQKPFGRAWLAANFRRRIRSSAELQKLMAHAGRHGHFLLAALYRYMEETARPPSKPIGYSHDVRYRARHRSASRAAPRRPPGRQWLPDVWAGSVPVPRERRRAGRPKRTAETPDAVVMIYGRLLTDHIYRTAQGTARRRYRNWSWVAALLTRFSVTRRVVTPGALRRLVQRSRDSTNGRGLSPDLLAKVREFVASTERYLST
jgi:hypothetical protein